jgi:hypothetical protein
MSEEELFEVGAGFDLSDPNSALAPFYCRTSHVVLVGFLAAFFTVFTLCPVWYTDVWAHLRFGQEIVRQCELPKHEPFPESFANKEAEYTHYQWLAQAGAYLLYQAGGALAGGDADHRLAGGAVFLASAHATILVLRLLLLYLAFQRLSKSPPVALLGVALVAGMGLMVHLIILRPQILGELAFAAVLLPLSRPLPSWRAAWLWVPLVFLLWANCHGSFVMGFVLLGAVTAGRALEVLRDSRHPRALVGDEQLRRLAVMVALSVAATCVNPHGPHLLVNSYLLSQSENIQKMEEWKPLPYQYAVHYAFFGSVVLLAALLRLSPSRFTPAQVILLLGFGLQSVAHARMVVWWIMVFAWVAVPHIRAAAGRLAGTIPWLDDSSVPSFRKTAAAVTVAVSLLLWSQPASWLVWGQPPGPRARVASATPVHVLDRIRTVDAARVLGARLSAATPLEAATLAPALPPAHVIFASETLGDYLLWDLGQPGRLPGTRVCCYTHVHLFDKEYWDRCMLVKEAKRGWQETLDKMAADVLVLEEDRYEQARRREQGKPPGYSNLIDHVREAGDRWQVISEPGQPVFIAQRMR